MRTRVSNTTSRSVRKKTPSLLQQQPNLCTYCVTQQIVPCVPFLPLYSHLPRPVRGLAENTHHRARHGAKFVCFLRRALDVDDPKRKGFSSHLFLLFLLVRTVGALLIAFNQKRQTNEKKETKKSSLRRYGYSHHHELFTAHPQRW